MRPTSSRRVRLLDEPLDESPAIVWLKDLDGRYLRVNRRYVEQLGTDAERVCGRTDAELTAAGSIEGLRLEEKDIAGREPLELEYLIDAFEERPSVCCSAVCATRRRRTADRHLQLWRHRSQRPRWPVRSATG